MHTAHFLTPWGEWVSLQRTPQDIPPGQRLPLTETPSQQRPLWTETPNEGTCDQGQRPPRRNMGSGSQTGSDIIQTPPPPMDRMTDTCKNITLPQSSFAGGKNLDNPLHACNECTFAIVVVACVEQHSRQNTTQVGSCNTRNRN